MLQLLPFSYTRHSLSFHLCNTLSLLGTAAAPSNTHVFQFPFLVSLYTLCNTTHSTTQHNTAQLFSTLFPLQALCMCVCVCNTPCLYNMCVCVCRSFTTAISLCFMLSFFLLPSLCTRIHTHMHTLLALARAHTREQQQQHAGTQRNAAPQDSVFIRDDTGRITALGNR